MHNSKEKQPDPAQGFFLVRHGQDNDTLTTELDQPLIHGSFSQINSLASIVKTMFSAEITFTIMHGPSKRTSQTAQRLAMALLKSRYTVSLKESVDIKEFCQGKFQVDRSLLVNGKYAPLETAWEIFNTKVVDGEVHYRFGDPIVNAEGEPTFPLLQSFFTGYGETQAEFLYRIRRFVSVIGGTGKRSNHLCVVVTHQAVASRIQREITGKRLQLGYCEGVFVPYLEV